MIRATMFVVLSDVNPKRNFLSEILGKAGNRKLAIPLLRRAVLSWELELPS